MIKYRKFLSTFSISFLHCRSTYHFRMQPTVPKDLSSKLKLADGYEIPYFGLGTYACTPGQEGTAIKAVSCALKHGYRLLDTAQMYKNEKEVGLGIKDSGVPREEIYVVTKLSEKGNVSKCKETFMESLKKLDTGFVDLYLIHTPRGGNNIAAYDAMLELQSQGLIRSIGVSNFSSVHLEELKKANKPTPVVNQIELHPFCRYENEVAYCLKNNIALMGFCPLARGKFFNDPTLVEVAAKHKKSVSDVMLRWSVQSGYITIPKSDKEARIISNANIFDFSLDESDMKRINNVEDGKKATEISLSIPWEG